MGGTKSNNRGKAKKKSSGPKGKKARAKSKLDRVWGESYDVNEREASRVRIGRSRLLHATANTTNNTKGEGGRTHAPPIVADDRRHASSSYSNDGGGIGSNGRTWTKGRDREGRAEDTDTDDDDDGAEGGGGIGGSGPSPLSTLLRRIGSTRMARYEYNDDDEEDEDDDEEEEQDDGSSSDDDADDDVNVDDDNEGCDAVDIAGRIESSSAVTIASTAISKATPRATCDEDPYDAHFSRDVTSSPNDDPSSSSLDATTKSIIIPPSIVPLCQSTGMMEISLAGRLLAAWEDYARVAIADDGAWEGFARGPYRHVRKVLSDNWDVVNKSLLATSSSMRQRHKQLPNEDFGPTVVGHLRDSMTPLQLAIYPAISRYADVLITSETRRVSERERG